MDDRATLEALKLVMAHDRVPMNRNDHRRLRELSREASEESRKEHWPRIWGEFAERFDAR
jgi:hypothetical protein